MLNYPPGERIRIGCSVDPIELDVVQAVPVGLILNEAITNAIKYAFPDGACGQIDVVIRATPERSVAISISDNGVGIPESTDLTQTKSLGMSLLNGLSRQLDGRIGFSRAAGLPIDIEFPLQDIRQLYPVS